MRNPAMTRIARYRETAAALRRQAEQVRSNPGAIEQLVALANEWEKLADAVEQEWR
jgi:hypothetical protein